MDHAERESNAIKEIIMNQKQVDNKKDFTQNSETDGRGKHPNSQANLKSYPKGVTGNPGGRPTKFAKLKKSLDRIGAIVPMDVDLWGIGGDTEYATNKEKVLHKIWFEAGKGSIKHIMILAEVGCLDDED